MPRLYRPTRRYARAVQGFLDVPRWWIEIAFVLYAIVITAIVMLERRRPSSTLAWILA